jgi:hypothetical protein
VRRTLHSEELLAVSTAPLNIANIISAYGLTDVCVSRARWPPGRVLPSHCYYSAWSRSQGYPKFCIESNSSPEDESAPPTEAPVCGSLGLRFLDPFRLELRAESHTHRQYGGVEAVRQGTDLQNKAAEMAVTPRHYSCPHNGDCVTAGASWL